MAAEQAQFRVSVLDATQQGFSKALRSFGKFSSMATAAISRTTKGFAAASTAPFKALGSLNMMATLYNVQAIGNTFRAVYDGMDRIATESAKMKVVDASFESMSGRAGVYADKLAKRLQDAALGMVTLTRAKEVANRALASGMSVDQLETAMEFISKKSATTGIEAGQALQTVITGLSRGSTLFLDDFGVLVDGVDQVKRDFDAIKGKGAFDQLGPAAQKAEIVRAAIADMQRQMGMIGVRGDELVFKLGRIKTRFAEIALKAGEALLPFADALSGTLDRAAEKVGGVVESFAEAVTRNYGRIKAMFSATFDALGFVLSSTLTNAWRGFTGSLGSGDLVKGLSLAFAKLPLYLAKGWLKMKDVFGEFIKHFLQGIGKFTIILGEGLGKAMSLFGWGGVKKGQEVTDAFADAGAEIHAMGLKAQIAMRVTAHETEAVEKGLAKIDAEAAKMKTNFANARFMERIGDAFKTAYNSARAFFAGLNPTEKFKAMATAAQGAAEKAAKAGEKIWEAFKKAGDAVKEATDRLNAARGEKWSNKIQEWQEQMAMDLARAGGNEWAQNDIKFRAARKAMGMAGGFQGDPEIRKQFLDFAMGILGEMRTDPRNMFGKPAQQVGELFAKGQGIRREMLPDEGKARQDLAAKEQEAEQARHAWVEERKRAAAKEAEAKAVDATVKAMQRFEVIVNNVGRALVGLVPRGAGGVENPVIGFALSALEARLGGG